MTHQLIDAVNPDNIPAEWNGKPALRITVLADDQGEAFDSEPGNAGPVEVAQAVKRRTDRGAWSVVYVDEAGYAEQSGQLSAAGQLWKEPADWPAPGPYLWAADPSGNIARGTWKVTSAPLLVQVDDLGPYDLSTVDDVFPAAVAGYIDGPVSRWQPKTWARFTAIATPGPKPAPEPQPAPAPTPAPKPSEVVTVLLPVLQEGSEGDAVRAVQRLTANAQVDGIYGPVTRAYVENFQRDHGLAVDGIVGQHTWGGLLGAPQ